MIKKLIAFSTLKSSLMNIQIAKFMIEIQGFSAFIIPPYKKEVLADYSTDIHNNEKFEPPTSKKERKVVLQLVSQLKLSFT